LKQMDFGQFSGIVEMDATYFLYSEKGKRNLNGRKTRKRGASQFRGISKEQVCLVRKMVINRCLLSTNATYDKLKLSTFKL